MINGLMLGIIVASSLTAGAFFLRFWLQTRDLLFLGFAAAFLIEGVNRLVFAFVEDFDGPHPILYSIRLVSYVLILSAIAHKNWGGQTGQPDASSDHR
ncbi:MAG TPA: DUF5985 family protein [Dehalococcoidia bacterium]|jgi:hypothetical protein